MVHPYLRWREGLEPVTYSSEALRRVLGKMLGVPLFQEQAMQVAMVAAGFSAAEADQLRRAMATFKVTGGVNRFRDKLVTGMVDNGYAPDFAERTFKQLEGFGSYGFPESHAASFALLAYASSWLKCHHPDAFCRALLNAQPMGFYAPAQLVRDARQHGVVVRPVCVNASAWDCTLEPLAAGGHAVRLGLRLAKGLAEGDGRWLVAVRGAQAFASVLDLSRRAAMPVAALTSLARVDAFYALGLGRHEAAWAIKALRDDTLPLFAEADRRATAFQPEIAEAPVPLPLPGGQEVVEDYRAQGLSLRAHPLAFLRRELAAQGAVPCASLHTVRDGSRITVASLVLMRQKPSSAKGVMFLTLEDETGNANLIVWPALFETHRRIILGSQLLACCGRVQRATGVVHLIAERLTDHTPLLRGVGGKDEAFTLPTGRGEEATHGGGPDARETAPLHKPRDIFIPDLRLGDSITVKARNFR